MLLLLTDIEILIFEYWTLKKNGRKIVIFALFSGKCIFYLSLWYNNTYIDIQYWNYSQLRIQKNKDQVCVTFIGHTIFFSQKWNEVFPESEIVSYIWAILWKSDNDSKFSKWAVKFLLFIFLLINVYISMIKSHKGKVSTIT